MSAQSKHADAVVAQRAAVVAGGEYAQEQAELRARKFQAIYDKRLADHDSGEHLLNAGQLATLVQRLGDIRYVAGLDVSVTWSPA